VDVTVNFLRASSSTPTDFAMIVLSASLSLVVGGALADISIDTSTVTVSDAVGGIVGTGVGAGTGTLEGAGTESFEGAGTGSMVGEADGNGEGAPEGSCEGAPEGSCEGAPEGSWVGADVVVVSVVRRGNGSLLPRNAGEILAANFSGALKDSALPAAPSSFCSARVLLRLHGESPCAAA